MARGQSAALDRKKLMADPIMMTTIVVLIAFLTLFILYPLAILLVDSFVGDGGFGFSVFQRIFQMPDLPKSMIIERLRTNGGETTGSMDTTLNSPPTKRFIRT